MSHRGKKSNVFIAGFITVAVIAICIFFKFKVKDIKAENDAGDKKIEQLENELASLKSTNSASEDEVSQLKKEVERPKKFEEQQKSFDTSL